MKRPIEASPHLVARTAGVFYLLTFLTAGLEIIVGSRLFVPGNAAATSGNILTHTPRMYLDLTLSLLGIAWYIVVTALFYELFKPVSKHLTVVAAFFSLVGCAIQSLACVFLLAPLVVLERAQYLSVFSAGQLQALSLAFLKIYTQGYDIGLAFFGVYDFVIGYLVFRSTFLPRTVGVLMMIAGAGFLTFFSPPLAKGLEPIQYGTGVVGEGLLMLWLLIFSVSDRRWQEQAALA